MILFIYFRAAKDKTLEAKGWPETAYGASKVGVTVMSITMAEELKSDPRGITVNAVSIDPYVLLYLFILLSWTRLPFSVALATSIPT